MFFSNIRLNRLISCDVLCVVISAKCVQPITCGTLVYRDTCLSGGGVFGLENECQMQFIFAKIMLFCIKNVSLQKNKELS